MCSCSVLKLGFRIDVELYSGIGCGAGVKRVFCTWMLKAAHYESTYHRVKSVEEVLLLQAGRRQSQNVAASNAMRAGDNASQHSGDESPWGHRSPGIAPGGPACSQQHPDYNDPMDGMFMDVADDMHSKDLECQDADKDERRFRSARLQKRAEREGPRLTQVCTCP